MPLKATAPRFAILVATALIASACVDDTGDGVFLPEADFEAFASDVQPILSERCANPSCHGNDGRPLQVYAPQKHRLLPAELHLDLPLSEEELNLNFDRARGFVLGSEDADECSLLTKPLALGDGGSIHAGVDVFETTDDPEFTILHDWVVDALEASP